MSRSENHAGGADRYDGGTYTDRQSKRFKILLKGIHQCLWKLETSHRRADAAQEAKDQAAQMLKLTFIAAYESDLVEIALRLLQNGISRRVAVKLVEDTLLPCCHTTRLRGANTHHDACRASASNEQKQIAVCALFVSLSRGGNHDVLFNLLAEQCRYRVTTAFAAENQGGCVECFKSRKELVHMHQRDWERNLSMARLLAAEDQNWDAVGKIMLLMVRQSDETHLPWSRRELTNACEGSLLRAFKQHKIDVDSVSVAGNRSLSVIPRALVYMKSLHTVNISFTKIGEHLPSDLFLMPRLAELLANDCELTDWPVIESITPSLTSVSVKDNPLTDVPPAFATSKITRLNVSATDISELTVNITRMERLTSLDISNTDIRDLPGSFLRLENLAGIELGKLSLPSDIRRCGNNLAKIRECLSKRAQRMCSASGKKIMVVGTGDSACKDIIDDLDKIPSLKTARFLDCGTVNEYCEIWSPTFDAAGHSTYLLCCTWDASLTADENQRRICEEVVVLSSFLRNRTRGARLQDVGQIICAVPVDSVADTECVNRVSSRGTRLHPVCRNGSSIRQKNLAKLASTVASAKCPRLQVPQAFNDVSEAVRARRQLGPFAFLQSAAEFKQFLLRAGVRAPTLLDGPASWFNDISKHLLLMGEGILLRGVHPLFNEVLCTNLQLLLNILRLLVGTARPRRNSDSNGSETPVVQDAMHHALSALGWEVSHKDGQMEDCIRSLAKRCGLAFPIEASPPRTYLPLLCPVHPVPDHRSAVHRPGNVHRVCSVSPKLTIEAWRRYQSALLSLQEKLHQDCKVRDGFEAQLWKNGIAFMSDDHLVAMVQFDPPYNFSPALSSSSVVITISDRHVHAASAKCLGPLVDSLTHVCAEMMPASVVDHFVPCSECMASAQTQSTAVRYRKAAVLVDLYHNAQPPSIACQMHRDELALPNHLADFLVFDFIRHFPPCTWADLNQDCELPRGNEPGPTGTSASQETLPPLSSGNAAQLPQPLAQPKPLQGRAVTLSSRPLPPAGCQKLCGSFAEVHFGYKLGGTNVVVKVFTDENMDRDQYSCSKVQNLRKELTIYSAMHGCPFFLQFIRPVIRSRTEIALVMDCRGQSLGKWMEEMDSLSAPQLLQVIVQISLALAKLHSAHLVHRDVKMENVLVSRKGPLAEDIDCWLIDFNTTASVAQCVLRSADGAGTAEYRAPEISVHETGLEYGSATDIYSLGLLIFELLAGKRLSKVSQDPRTRVDKLVSIARMASGLWHGTLLNTALKCIEQHAVNRPPAEEIVHYLSSSAAERFALSWELNSRTDVSTIISSPVPVGVGQTHLLSIGRDYVAADSGCLFAIQGLYLPPNELFVEQITSSNASICSFCVTDHGQVVIGRKHEVEVYHQIDEAESRLAGKVFSITAPQCMASAGSWVFAGQESGDITIIETACAVTKMESRPHRVNTITCIPDVPIQQIVPVPDDGSIMLWCLSSRSEFDAQISVIGQSTSSDRMTLLLPIDQVYERTESVSHPVCKMAKSSVHSTIIWHASGQWLYAWNTSTCEIVARHHIADDIPEMLNFGDEFDLLDESRRPTERKRCQPTNILCLCAANSTLWVGLSSGDILTYTDDIGCIELKAMLSAHCKNVRHLLVLSPGSGLDGREDDHPQVLSVGVHSALECAHHQSALKSSAELYRESRPGVGSGGELSHTGGYVTAILWKA